jgi:hypothetical protein
MSPVSPWLRVARILTLLVCLFLLAVFVAGSLAYPDYARRHPEDFTIFAQSSGDLALVGQNKKGVTCLQ